MQRHYYVDSEIVIGEPFVQILGLENTSTLWLCPSEGIILLLFLAHIHCAILLCTSLIRTLRLAIMKGFTVQSNLSYLDSCYPGTSLNRAADLPYFMLTLQKLWAVQ